MAGSCVALLWDESFLWGLMAYRSFTALGIDTCVVTAEDVRAGALGGYDILVVPGGWASDKTVALGDAGREAIKSFVAAGGSYLGLCGGAGLALDVDGGLALTHVSRIPTKHRVPSFSGEIELVPDAGGHPLWSGLKAPYFFPAWWPGQFHIGDGGGVKVVARYGRPGRDFATADLPAADMARTGANWEKWEETYGINLNPERLVGEPAILEAQYGTGVVFLSYMHLETPGSSQGNRALVNLIDYLGEKAKGSPSPPAPLPSNGEGGKAHPLSKETVKTSKELFAAAKEFITFGERNFLWYWRNHWILQWRRGVRGVEYSMLYGLIKEIAECAKAGNGSADPEASEKILALKERATAFFEDAKALLLLERLALMNGGMSSIKSHDPEVTRLRERLFSNSKRFGGEFKRILDALGETVLGMIAN